MTDEDRDSAEYLRGARRRIKRRGGAMMALVLGPVILLGAGYKVIERHDYPAGDVRNDPVFWAGIFLFFLVLIGAMMVRSIRLFLDGDRS